MNVLVYNVSHADLVLGARIPRLPNGNYAFSLPKDAHLTSSPVLSSTANPNASASTSNGVPSSSSLSSSSSSSSAATPATATAAPSIFTNTSSSFSSYTNSFQQNYEPLLLCRPKFSYYQPMAERVVDAFKKYGIVDLLAPLHDASSNQNMDELNDHDTANTVSSDATAAVAATSSSKASSGNLCASCNHSDSMDHDGIMDKHNHSNGKSRLLGSSLSTEYVHVGMALPQGDKSSFIMSNTCEWSQFHLPSKFASLENEMLAMKLNNLNNNSNAEQINPVPDIRAAYLPLLAQAVPMWLRATSEDSPKVIILLCGAGRPRNTDHPFLGNSTQGTAVLMRLFLEKYFPGVVVKTLDSGLDVFKYDENFVYVRRHLLPYIEEYRRELAEKNNKWKNLLQVTIALTDGPTARIGAINASLRSYHPFYLHAWQLKTFWHESRLISSDMEYVDFDTVETVRPIPIFALDDTTRALVAEMIAHKINFEECRDRNKLTEINDFWLRKTHKPVLSVLMVQKPTDTKPRYFRGINVEVSMPTGSVCSERNAIGSALASDPTITRKDMKMIAVLSMTLSVPSQSASSSPEKKRQRSSSYSHEYTGYISNENSNNGVILSAAVTGPSNPPSHPLSFEDIRAPGDLNPMDPCGACVEWLKHIAEVNPDFKVITFPTSHCTHAYVKEVHHGD